MSDTLHNFIAFLQRSGILSEAEASNIRDVNEDGTVRDSDAILADVSGHLTEFQLSELREGKADKLILGDHLLILDRLGRGGMGQVFLARHTLMKRNVAVKFILPDDDEKANASRKERFIREVQTASKLSHPNIVGAMDAGFRGDLCFLVMEHVPGANLGRLVRTTGPMSLTAALDVIVQVARGLEYAHGKGIIHRDIKPSNLLRRDDGVVKILDMGLARVEPLTAGELPDTDATENDWLTRRGQLLGTIDYMAPEQAADPRQADGRSDIYSLGCTLYFLLTGTPPFKREESPLSRLIAHRESPVPLLAEVRKDVPETFQACFEKMLAKSPRQRYNNVAELLVDLEAARSREAEAVATLDETVRLDQPVAKRRRGVGAIALGLLLVVGLVLWQTGLVSRWRTADDMPTVITNAEKSYRLLEQLVLRRDVLAPPQLDRWELTSDRLVMPEGDPTAKLRFRAEVADDFRLQLAVSRRSGAGPLAIGIVARQRQFLFLVDRRGGTLLLTANGRAAANVPDSLRISEAERSQLEVQVRGREVRLLGDGVELISYPDIATLDPEPRQGWSIGDTEAFFIGSNERSSFEITELKLGPLPSESAPNSR
ncbi:MAG: serine/threonine protein kinase [Planctomycetales bacterium]|nr:serine/threonine protein kinase [Planctomycetales bacterium]